MSADVVANAPPAGPWEATVPLRTDFRFVHEPILGPRASRFVGRQAELNALTYLFTTSGISFVFVAGKDVQERWLEDLGRGDGVYESVFSYDKYLPCMWADVESLCDGLVEPDLLQLPASAPPRRTFEDFKKFLIYKGRGIPRRVIRGFNEYVQWVDGRPVLAFSRPDLRRIRFYARLQTALAQREAQCFGQIPEEVSGTQRDKRQLGAYYRVDWILRRGTVPFARADAIRASAQLSAKIAPAEEVAPRVIDDLVEFLLREQYVEQVRQTLDQTRIGIGEEKTEARYRVVEARLHQLGGMKGGLDEEAPPARSRTRPQRRQAGQRHGQYGRPRIPHGLRHEPQPPRHDGVDADQDGRDRHALLHGARAGSAGDGRRPLRHLRLRRRGLRDGRRPPAAGGGTDRRDRAGAPAPGSAAAVPVRAAAAPGALGQT